jgi:hypothetical protein
MTHATLEQLVDDEQRAHRAWVTVSGSTATPFNLHLHAWNLDWLSAVVGRPLRFGQRLGRFRLSESSYEYGADPWTRRSPCMSRLAFGA